MEASLKDGIRQRIISQIGSTQVFTYCVKRSRSEPPKFLALQQENESLVLVYKNRLKANIISCAFFIANSHTNIDPHHLVNTLQDQYHKKLLKNASTTLAKFRRLYMEAHSLTTLPNLVLAPYQLHANLSQDNIHLLTQPGDVPPTVPHSNSDHRLDKPHHALDAAFLCPWDIYQDTTKKLTISLELQTLSTSYFTEEAAKNAQTEVNNKAPADRQQLQELIQKQNSSIREQETNQRAQCSQTTTLCSQFGSKKHPKGLQWCLKQKENACTLSRARNSTHPTFPVQSRNS
jgi:hypothetical protein